MKPRKEWQLPICALYGSGNHNLVSAHNGKVGAVAALCYGPVYFRVLGCQGLQGGGRESAHFIAAAVSSVPTMAKSAPSLASAAGPIVAAIAISRQLCATCAHAHRPAQVTPVTAQHGMNRPGPQNTACHTKALILK